MSTVAEQEPILEVENLSKTFITKRNFIGRPTQHVAAVQDVNLSLKPGKTLALVGESGSGKSTTARLIAQLEHSDTGSVTVCGKVWSGRTDKQLRAMRHDLQMIFQDPYASLDPTKMIVHIVGEPLKIHLGLSGKELDTKVADLLEQVGLSPRHIHRYPYEFSGGQRQRVAVARALAANPKIVIADEAVSALDVSTQAQVLNLLLDIQRERQLSFLFISHDLGVVRQVADEIAVMYLGRIVEKGPADCIYQNPQHPYTRSLLAAVPEIDPANRSKRIPIEGDPPSPTQHLEGCAYRSRCPIAIDICATIRPELAPNGKAEVACHVTAPRRTQTRQQDEVLDK